MHLSQVFGPSIEDTDEEHFILFSSDIPSSNLGFWSNTSSLLNLTIADEDLIVHQSLGLLSSDAVSGTTGAVLWKVTPLVAEWLLSPDNILLRDGLLRYDGSRDDNTGNRTSILELGCGITGVLAMSMRKRVARYIATDVGYILKGLRRNLVENGAWTEVQTSRNQRTSNPVAQVTRAAGPSKRSNPDRKVPCKIETLELDWTQSSQELLKSTLQFSNEISLIVACDCIYNESLVEPFVQTCIDVSLAASKPPICLVAQQLRSDLVFEAWLKAFHARFETWRVPDEFLSPELQMGLGYVVHIGIIRESERPAI